MILVLVFKNGIWNLVLGPKLQKIILVLVLKIRPSSSMVLIIWIKFGG